MKWSRDYTCLTDEDVERHIENIWACEKISRRHIKKPYIIAYCNAERDLNLTIPEATRNIWRAQQVLLEKSFYVKATKCMASKMSLEEEYAKKYKWLSDESIIKIIRSKPRDEHFHFHGDD